MLLEYLQTQLKLSDHLRTYFIAYSGGLDSHVLLHAMAQLRQQIPELSLQAIHVHHGLSPQADNWMQHCREICAALNIELHGERILQSPQRGDSVEAWARTARYAVFAKILSDKAVLLTAHTQDDQAETALLQLLRGAGPKGLAAMPQQQIFAKGFLARPLLNLTRQQLQQYAKQQQLSWIEDESNTDPRFDRNFLRHRVIPVLRERWPSAAKNIARTASHCAAAAEGLAELAQQDLGEYADAPTVPLALLQSLSAERQCNALRYWLQRQGCRLPNTRHIQQIQQNLINGRADSQPQVSWERWTIRRFQQNLMVTPVDEQIQMDAVIAWNLSMPLPLPHNLGCLSAVQQINGGLSLAINPDRLTIRFRQGGERCRPAGKTQSSSLKKLLHEWQVPPWQRASIPLLYHEDELAAVIGYCICAPFAAAPDTMSWRLSLVG